MLLDSAHEWAKKELPGTGTEGPLMEERSVLSAWGLRLNTRGQVKHRPKQYPVTIALWAHHLQEL